MPFSEHLQGACCQAMDYRHYQAQLRGLRAYRRMSEVPQDPYDVQVGLARRLLDYDASKLTSGQRAAFRAAFARAHEKGPCCCHCWRWMAFRGQAKYLIAHRHFTGTQVARLWDLEDGCGGPGDGGRVHS